MPLRSLTHRPYYFPVDNFMKRANAVFYIIFPLRFAANLPPTIDNDEDSRIEGRVRVAYEFNPRRLLPLLDRACPHCDARMRLAVIEPSRPGSDKLIFECVECGGEEFMEVKFREERKAG